MKKEKLKNKIAKSTGKIVFFATGNIYKFNEAREALSKFNIAVIMLKVKENEIQSNSLAEIAKHSALEAFKKYGIPIIVEDTGLFIESLHGFPGPYAAYVYKTIGNIGIIKLMKRIKNRTAVFRSSIAFCYSHKQEPELFEGTILGTIALKVKQSGTSTGFGFDPIFQPEGNLKVFSLMSIAEKNLFSHRAIAFRKFAEWYLNQ